MIVVKVELHSAITGEVRTIAKAEIANEGTGSKTVGNYTARFMGRRGTVNRIGHVTGHRRLALSVWSLIRKALEGVDY